MFYKGSRYELVKTLEIKNKNGHIIHYKSIRFIPETESRMGHIISQGERLDHIAFKYYKDPERFWRICDANKVMKPDDLIKESGETINIPSSIG